MSKKKEKITYVDDGRTIADMSGVSGGFHIPEQKEWVPRASFKEQLGTFWAAVKMMFRPMLVVVAGMIIIYLIMKLLLLNL